MDENKDYAFKLVLTTSLFDKGKYIGKYSEKDTVWSDDTAVQVFSLCEQNKHIYKQLCVINYTFSWFCRDMRQAML